MMTRKKTVLVLLTDVRPPARAIISRALNPADFEVLWTANLSGAEEVSTRHRVDLLVLDLNGPRGAGWAIFERLATLNRGTPVIILTDHKAAYAEAVADQAGAVMQKPLSVSALGRAIDTLLGKRSPDAAVATNHEAGLGEVTTKSDDFREMLYQRYTAPYTLSSSHRHWGINE